MPHRYLLFYKPYHVMSQFTQGSTPPKDGAIRRTLSDFVPVDGVYPAGRLDFDSEGLLLLTDDAQVQHRLTDPRYEHPRTYWVQVEGTITQQALQRLRTGITIQGYRTLPCRAAPMPAPVVPERVPPVRARKHIPDSWLEMTLTEGRNRQVRRMCAAVGFPVLRLIRYALGGLTIGALQPGQYRVLTPADLARGVRFGARR